MTSQGCICQWDALRCRMWLPSLGRSVEIAKSMVLRNDMDKRGLEGPDQVWCVTGTGEPSWMRRTFPLTTRLAQGGRSW
jgi:hypothetical protein